MSRKKEIWAKCPGYERYYDISNYGRVRSYHVHNGVYDRKIEPSFISIQYSPTFEYLYVCLSRGIGVVKTLSVHILVAKAFVPNPNRRKHVHHKNNIKTDPYAGNLEWVTQGQNQEYAYADGQRKRPNGELNGRCKLTEKEVLEIFKSQENHYKLAAEYGVNRGAIGNIKSGKLWSSVTGKKYKKRLPLKKLKDSEVLEILNSVKDQNSLAKEYSISQSRVSAIKTGRSYSDITGVKFNGKTEYEYFGLKSTIKKAA